MEFTADVYWAAAKERAGSLRQLYDAGEFALALYVAGVAVESMFRAFLVITDPEFSSRHDLRELAREAKFAQKVPAELYDASAADLGIIVIRWSNSHRYRSNAAILKYLKRAGLDRRIKGDALKENARRSINAAISLVAVGTKLWKR